jgi:hypothetical protein
MTPASRVCRGRVVKLEMLAGLVEVKARRKRPAFLFSLALFRPLPAKMLYFGG